MEDLWARDEMTSCDDVFSPTKIFGEPKANVADTGHRVSDTRFLKEKMAWIGI